MWLKILWGEVSALSVNCGSNWPKGKKNGRTKRGILATLRQGLLWATRTYSRDWRTGKRNYPCVCIPFYLGLQLAVWAFMANGGPHCSRCKCGLAHLYLSVIQCHFITLCSWPSLLCSTRLSVGAAMFFCENLIHMTQNPNSNKSKIFWTDMWGGFWHLGKHCIIISLTLMSAVF